MEAANVHSLDERRAAAAAGELEPPTSEFDLVNPDDLGGEDAPDPDPIDDVPEVPTDGEPTEADLEAIEAEQPGDEPVVPETPAEDTGPCTVCSGKGYHRMGGDGSEDETCDACAGTGREGAQGTLGVDGAGDTHVDTGQARMFAADAYDEVGTGSRMGGRRATTGKVAISGASVDALKLDPRNRIPKGATIRLEVVGTVAFVGERDKLKDGFHAGTTREHSVKASHVQVVSWLHDEDGLRWDEDHGLRERVRDGVWQAVDTKPEPEADEPQADGGEQPGFGTADDAKPEGVPEHDLEPGTVEQDGPPTEAPAIDPATDPEPAGDEPVVDPEPAPAKPKGRKGKDAPVAAAVILGRPETYTAEALANLKKDELREVLTDLEVSGVPARIDHATLLAMANTAAGNLPA